MDHEDTLGIFLFKKSIKPTVITSPTLILPQSCKLFILKSKKVTLKESIIDGKYILANSHPIHIQPADIILQSNSHLKKKRNRIRKTRSQRNQLYKNKRILAKKSIPQK